MSSVISGSAAVRVLLRQPSRHFEHVVSAARIAASVAGDFLQHIVGGAPLHVAKPTFFDRSTRAAAVAQSDPLSAAAEHRRGSARAVPIDLERWILGRRADQADVAFLHVRQKRVLLRLVEAMNFVDEDDGARAILARPLGIGHHLLDLFDPGQHGGEFDELRFGHVRDDLRQRGFAGARGSPEDERSRVVAVNLHA